MRKISIGVIFLLIAASAFPQAVLQFNQALLVGTSPMTVPAGKVWKAEGIIAPRVSISYTSAVSDHQVVVNGNTVSVQYNGFHSGYTYSAQTNIGYATSLPWWLPAGTTLQAGSNVTYISVLEFNLLSP